MNIEEGWLERSLEQAHQNIQARPEHLKPARYRANAGQSAAKDTKSKSEPNKRK